ncbi:hypothetical protein [Streptomyces sp. NBC_00306]|uniref:hypothetical protein n=1 Tax=Streptomyces sp. NBC_00306 TaxID=2975708 RepID=UPI002E281AFD|nr:hypothetical protein [Streptomyces sp. NBC_00306]
MPGNQWTSLSTSLAITNTSGDAAIIGETLGVEEAGATHAPLVNSGPGWWAYTFNETYSASIDSQIAALVSFITPHLDRLAKLRNDGYYAQVAIAGTVSPGENLHVSTTALQRVAALGLSVSFTTLAPSGTTEDDPLNWLD